MNIGTEALKALSKRVVKKVKTKPSLAKDVMTENKALIIRMVRSGGTTTTVSESIDVSPSCIRKHLAAITSKEIKALCKANGELVSAKNGSRNTSIPA